MNDDFHDVGGQIVTKWNAVLVSSAALSSGWRRWWICSILGGGEGRSPVFFVLGHFVPKWRKLDILVWDFLQSYNIDGRNNRHFTGGAIMRIILNIFTAPFVLLLSLLLAMLTLLH